MLSIIVTGHGGFASGLSLAITQIMGQQPQFVTIDFTDGMSSEELEQLLELAVAQNPSDKGVVFLTDILGGSPFRQAALLSMQLPNSEVICGTNMQMLIALLLERENLTIAQCSDVLIDAGREGITSFALQTQQNVSKDAGDNDGI